jgi:DNA-binding NarL/FixJ family response regulator
VTKRGDVRDEITRAMDKAPAPRPDRSSLWRPHGDSHHLALVGKLDHDSDRSSQAICVLIAAGASLARAGLGALLDAEAEMEVLGSAATEAEAVDLAGAIRPDVLLIDITQPERDATRIDGAQVTRRIVADPETSAVQVLILGASEHDEEILSSLRAGASGFLSRDIEPAELVDGVRTVAAGHVALSSSGVRRVINQLSSQPDPRLPSPEQLEQLTAREREVMALVAAGLSNGEIAELLAVANSTAKTHVSRAMGKLRAHDRAQLVTLAYETGLVLAGQPAAGRHGIATASFAAS